MAKKAAPKASTPPDGELVVLPAADLTAPPNLAPERPVWVASEEQIESVFNDIAGAESFNEISAKFEGLSKASVLRLTAAPEHASRYARAKDEMARSVARRIHEIGDNVLKGKHAPDAARVAIDAYKWTASKLLPREFGDKVEHSGQVQISLVQALAELSASSVPQLPPLPKD